MLYLILKSFHLIGIVCWFAGLFYIVRLFIYHVEALQQEEPSKSLLKRQFKIMERRLWYGITVPSMVVTVFCGIALLYLSPYLMKAPNYWMHAKLTLIIGLLGYHFYCQKILNQLKTDNCKLTSHQLRGYNEIATLLLCGIVFLVITRSIQVATISTIGLTIIGSLLFFIYARKRKKNPQ